MSANIDTDLVTRLAQRLLQSNFSLATAESCTGGGIGHWLTSIAGSSDWYQGGFITYSNEAKIRDLGVDSQEIQKEGAVSESVARQMVVGCAKRANTNVAVAVTGIAGPDGGSIDKPVGTVCFGWQINETTRVKTLLFQGDRTQIRYQAIECAISQLVNFLDEFSN